MAMKGNNAGGVGAIKGNKKKKMAQAEADEEEEVAEQQQQKKNQKTRKVNNKKNKKTDEMDEEVYAGPGSPLSSSSSAVAADAAASLSCCFPMSRVRRLIRSEEGNTGASTNRTTYDAVFLINKASEMFLEKFAEDAYASAVKRQKKSVTYRDLSSTVSKMKRYGFLSDFVPEQIKAEDALKYRTSVEA